jgi:iron complex outermembrane recepter protein
MWGSDMAKMNDSAAGGVGRGRADQSTGAALAALVLVGVPWLAGPAAAAAESEDSELSAIIVTAQRRAERLQDVPISIVSVNSVQLEQSGVRDVRDLADVTPGLRQGGSGVNFAPAIRGVTSEQPDPGNDANVATYVDGVYQAGQYANNNLALPDISRIEVLKGPQGTLFGRNATGGAVRIFTREPTLTQPTGLIEVGYGRYNDVLVKGFFSAPVIDNVFGMSLAGNYEKSDGYNRDVLTGARNDGAENRSVRLKLLAKPSDNSTVELFGAYTHSDDSNGVAYSALDGNSAGRLTPGAVIASQPYQFSASQPPTVDSKVATAGLRASMDTSVGEVSSLTTFNHTNTFLFNQADASTANVAGYPLITRLTEDSEELLLSSKQFGWFQFVAGANYYADLGRNDPLHLVGSAFDGDPVPFGYMKQKTNAYAAFTEWTFTPTDRLTLIAGGRYSREKRVANGGYFATPGRPGDLPLIGEVTYSKATPRASVRYRLTDDDDNAYFTYSKGFKSGGFNISSLQAVPFKPEDLSSYELGIKTAPNRMFSANISAFYYNYTNQQVISIALTTVTSNAAASHIYGADADITARLTKAFSLTIGMAGLSAKYQSYPNAAVNVPIGGPGCLCGNASAVMDLSGTTLPFSPKFTVTSTASYKKELRAGTVDLSAHVYYTTHYSYTYGINQAAYTTLGLRAGFQPAGSHFDYYLWGKNISNARYYYSTLISNTGNAVSYVAPATYGAGARYAF